MSSKLLQLKTYYTAGEMEARAWFCGKHSKAPQAAGAIHSDFVKQFQAVEIWGWGDLEKFGNKDNVRKAGGVKKKGKEYFVEDGDVLEFVIKKKSAKA